MTPSSPDQHESARQRALRIRLDYVHHPDFLARVKLLLTFLAVLVAAAYCAWAMFFRPVGQSHFSPGHVASAHQHFEHDCQACHANFIPLRNDSSIWPARLIGAVPAADIAQAHHSSARDVIAKRCQSCHVAMSHHRLERPADIVACATCHREHQGTSASLRQVANERCVTCHREIAEHRVGPSSLQPELKEAWSFTNVVEPRGVGHPEFRSLQSDPGTIKFHHQLHLIPGLPARDAKGRVGRPLKTLADLPPEFVERYRRLDQPKGVRPEQEYLVQLDCSSCHRSNGSADASGASIASSAEPPSNGEYDRPISYERDCRACHTLPFDADRPDDNLPHGLAAPAISNQLTQFYAADALDDSTEDEPDVASPDSSTNKARANRDPWRPQRLVPGRSGDSQARADVERTVVQRVTLAQQYLQRQAVCTKCHDVKQLAADDDPDADRSPQVVPAAIPSHWLRHARFNHQPHQSLHCRECHVTGNSKPESPLDRDLVMIAGRDTCLRCHSRSSTVSGESGPVRSDCVLCHQYHGADQTAHADAASPGASPPHSTPRRTISDWLAPTRPSR